MSGASIWNDVLAVRGMARHGNQQREYLRKSRMHTPGQLGQPACTRDSDHANNRQTDRTDRKSDKGQPRVSARLCTEIRRENQVSGAEKHGKQRKAYQKQAPSV